MTHSTIKPATPLPWECPGLDADEYVISASPKGKRRTIAHVYRHTDLGIQREENAAYIVHACNAYPELVAALRNARNLIRQSIANNQWADESTDEVDSEAEAQCVQDEADTLLARIGEG